MIILRKTLSVIILDFQILCFVIGRIVSVCEHRQIDLLIFLWIGTRVFLIPVQMFKFGVNLTCRKIMKIRTASMS